MFTGIVTNIGIVEESLPSKDFGCKLLLSVDVNSVKNRRLELGCSIACNGICLTLTDLNMSDVKCFMSFVASKETLDKTNLAQWKRGDEINLEFSLRVGDELGGHMLYGHVDGVAILKEMKQCGESIRLQFFTKHHYRGLIVNKGSVALNGVSLTVNCVEEIEDVYADSDKLCLRFLVNLIPYTIDNTNFRSLKTGSFVNLEIDSLARYIKSHLNSHFLNGNWYNALS